MSKLYGVQKQQLKNLSKNEYIALREMCFLSKNMYNVALYSVRQHFFTEKKYLNYNSNYHLCKENENYKLLSANAAQCTMKIVDNNFKSFFALIKKAKKGNYSFKDAKIPNYLPKDSYFELRYSQFNLTSGVFAIPMSPEFKRLYGKVNINIPSNLKDKTVKEIRIIPKGKSARFFEIQWIYEIPEFKGGLNKNNVLAIDLGVNNLCTCVSNDGNAFIIDGKRLKSINQWANKENSRLQGIKDKQKIKGITNKQYNLWNKRNNKVNDYINKTVKVIVNYAILNDIGTIVIGYNKTIQKSINLGKRNNQSFVNIPIGSIREKLEYQCQRYDITFVEQEESYTSKSDFLANDPLPQYSVNNSTKHKFSGRRITRGQYRSSTGTVLNADINGALNIMRKSGVNNINLINNQYLNPIRLKVN